MTDDDVRDERIFRLRLLGIAPRTIADQFAVSVADVNAAVDRKMVRVDAAYRARAFALDLERLDTLTSRCLDAVTKGSLAAGHLLILTIRKRAEMLGLDAPMRIDVTEIAGPRETTTEELRRVFDEMRGKVPGLPN
jgi:hypothetical protein